ncbi:hypothetical protein PInf_005826 [Phytophthora infestans]|nr:hypothetical protein PInf_005826 [Phytophthora infestans]
MPKMMPNSITELSLSNSLLTKFPEFLSSLTNLLILHLNDSYITFVHSSVYWEKLTVMDLQRNSFTTFEGNFPGLTLPYLNDNNLTEIPEIVFTFQHLTNFRIHNNSLLTRSFTEAQITFLQRLDSLDLAESDFQSAADCSLSEQRVTGDRNVVVCVSNPSTTQASSPSSASTESSDSSAPSVPIAGVSHSSGSDDDDSSTTLFELVENGHLSSYLSPSLPRYWTRVKLQLAVDVIEALVYIHAFTPPQTSVRWDLSRQTDGWHLKLSLVPVTTNKQRTFSRLVFFSRGSFDTHMQPYEDAASSNDNTMDVLQMVASGNLRPVFSDTCPPIILELAKQYMSQEPCDHPPAL